SARHRAYAQRAFRASAGLGFRCQRRAARRRGARRLQRRLCDQIRSRSRIGCRRRRTGRPGVWTGRRDGRRVERFALLVSVRMTLVAVGALLALAAVSLGLRTTSLLIPRAHPLVRLAASSIIGAILVVATLQICDRYRVHDLGLGLLLSVAPVGVYDLAKWWFRRKL